MPKRAVPLIASTVLAVVASGGASADGACSSGGCEAWVATYDAPAQQLDTPRNLGYGVRSLAVAPDGRTVFVTGTSFGGSPSEGGTHYDYATVAYDAATGDERWVARYAGPGNSQDSAWAIGVSPDGRRVFVTGMSVGRTDQIDWDYATVAYDAADGAPLWVARYDAGLVDRAWSLGVDPDGALVYVTGDSRAGAATTGDYVTIAYDAETGGLTWLARYDGPGHAQDDARSLAVAADGSGVYITGRSAGDGSGFDYATLAYDAATGDQRWAARYNGPANGWDEATAIHAAPDGFRVVVTGQSSGVGTGSDYATIAYDASDGTQAWVGRYDGPGSGVDIALATAVAHDASRVVVTGYSLGSGTSYDYGTVAYDAASGARQWVARYNGPPGNNSDNAYALAFGPDDGIVYVTGESAGASHYDIATVAYDAASSFVRGASRYNGPEDFQDGAFAISVAPDGSRVYVNGETWHSTSPGVGDYATIAYEASSLSGLGVSGLTIDASGTDVTVRGTALFGGEAPVAVGEDPAGDGAAGAVGSTAGMDLRRLTIAQPSSADPTLEFVVGLDGLAGGGIPEGVVYVWDVRVPGMAGGWSIQTARTRAPATGGSGPYAALLACPPAGSPCVEAAPLSATYDESEAGITVRVPLAAIGAGPGSRIEPWGREGDPVRILPTASGLADGPVVLDGAGHAQYTVPEKGVWLGIAPAGTPAGQVEFGVRASLAATDEFEGTVSAAELTGLVDVWVKVCFGDFCAARPTALELP